MTEVDKYLTYLNEIDAAVATKFVKSNIGSAVGWSLWIGLAITPAIQASIRLANQSFSKAYRKCGGFTKRSTPGLKVCVSKERIKILQQKLLIFNQILSNCNKAKDPIMCKQKIMLQIEKSKNRIEVEKNKIIDILGEQKNLQEISPALLKVGTVAAGVGSTASGIGIMLVAGMVADKAIFLALRTAAALFNSANRRCGVYKQKGSVRGLCIARVKLNSLKKQLTLYGNLLNNCAKKKNPEACKQKVQQKIEMIKRNIEVEENNIVAFQREIEIEKRDIQMKREMKV
jgi:hypothetical protein